MKLTYSFLLKLCVGYLSTIQCVQGQSPDIATARVPPLNNLEREIVHFESKVSSNTASAGSGQFSAHSHGPHSEHTEQQHHGHPNSMVPHDPASFDGPDKITDMHGNVPPHLGGLHVDLPGEHGNVNDFAVLHDGHVPLTPNGHDSPKAAISPSVLGPPDLNAVIGASGGLSISDGIHSSPEQHINHQDMNMHHEQHTQESNHFGPPDLFDIGIGQNPGHGHDHSGAHVDLPGEHNNNSPMPVVHRPVVPNPGFGHAQGHLGTHVDLPGMHGNDSPMPVVHRPAIQNTNNGHGHLGTHVDLPGMHGNNSPMPVVHRPVVPNPGLGHGQGHLGTHVDLPGVHGNNSPMPVVHRPVVPNPGLGHGQGHLGTHVDLPGMHGNNSPMPVVHRPVVSNPGLGHGQGHLGTHVDLPGMHGNDSPMPVVHRPAIPTAGSVDLPGIHEGNIPLPVHKPILPNPGHDHGHLGTHVDLPGEHNNNSPVPVVHRPVIPNPALGHDHGHLGTHVDLPGEHNNNSPVPVVHRPVIPNPALGHDHGHLGTHVDLPREQGNDFPLPVVNRPETLIHGQDHIETHQGLQEIHENNFPKPDIHTPPNPSSIGPPDLFEIHANGKTSPLADAQMPLPPHFSTGHIGTRVNPPPGVIGNPTILNPGLVPGSIRPISASPNLINPMLPFGQRRIPVGSTGVLHGNLIPVLNQRMPILRRSSLTGLLGPLAPRLVQSYPLLSPRRGDLQLFENDPLIPVVQTGMPKSSLNVPVVPNSRREERRRLRKLERKRLRRMNRAKGGLLDDIIKTSKAVKEDRPHKHNEKPKLESPKPRTITITHHSPTRGGGILGALLGSLSGGSRVRRIGGLHPHHVGPPRNPLQAVAGNLMGMLVNRLVSG